MKRLRKERLKPLWDDFEWWVVGGAAAAALILAFVGFGNQPGEALSFWDRLYRSLQLFWLEYGSAAEPTSWYLDVARLLAAGVLFYTAGSAIAAIFREQLQLLRLRFTPKERVVICGLGRKGWLLARSFVTRGYGVVIIERDEENDRISGCRAERIPVLVGDATDDALLRKARVHKTKYLICVCGEDWTNTEVAVRAHALVEAEGSARLTSFVHVVDVELCNSLRKKGIAPLESDSFRLEFFTVFESGARAWLSEHWVLGRLHARGSGPAHLVVVGVGNMGKSLVVGAVRQWLTLHPTDGERLRITMVDRSAEQKRESLRLWYPLLDSFCDLVPMEMEIESPEFERGDFLFDGAGGWEVTSVYVCLDDPARCLKAGQMLAQKLDGRPVPVIVRMIEDAGLAAFLRRDDERTGDGGLRAFPVLDRTCTAEYLLGETVEEKLARAIHERYREDQAGRKPADDPSMADWERLAEDLKESNRRAADHIRVKLATLDLAIAAPDDPRAERFSLPEDQVEPLAELEHDRWTAERLFEGWKPGERDPDAKTSPYLVSWAELDDDVREWDREAVRGLPALLGETGLRVVRRREPAEEPERAQAQLQEA